MPTYNQLKNHDAVMKDLGLDYSGRKKKETNHILTSTGINVIENRIIEPNAGWFDKESNTLFVGNIYPFIFLGCGKIYTLEQCLDFSFQYAMSRIYKRIESHK